jgi:hypothetical protein
MWKDTISSVSKSCNFADPVSSIEIQNSEKQLGIQLPAPLQSLLLETNGVYEIEHELHLVWTLQDIVKENFYHRTNRDYQDIYMPFDHLVFFAGAGNGDLFAFTVTANKQIRNDIFVWSHDDDSRTWVAPNLATYFDWWLSGKIEI